MESKICDQCKEDTVYKSTRDLMAGKEPVAICLASKKYISIFEAKPLKSGFFCSYLCAIQYLLTLLKNET